ncbi:WD40/YVTN/BNR-like repeat-containing protein [Undibacterium flavidum]|uniref:Photosynthesis system II assembly factor Ycf48/Hcf136-like domain-containing protein n=1 Tax=Undibacterium flavidum TaxID=2762297 RepID=A0ABR6YET3_9BURK|nr:YCF48-related protein [Undibacterium flavidum]MBC3875075.1 hypothetical protein [Undibacterium flavidum]
MKTSIWRYLICFLLLFVIVIAIRFQSSMGVCGEQFDVAPKAYSKAWWTCPIEINRHVRKVGNIGGQDLIDVASTSDGQRFWVLTKTGSIVTSEDGGETWKKLSEIGVNANYSSLAISDDGVYVWVIAGSKRDHMGDGTTQLFISADGGHSWNQLSENLENFPYQSHVLGVTWNRVLKRLFIVGERGSISYTENNGLTWHRPYQPVNVDSAGALKQIAFSDDGQIGWAVGENTVLTTADGGMHWRALDSAELEGKSSTTLILSKRLTLPSFNSLHLGRDGKKVWIAADNATLFESQDGGRQWKVKHVEAGAFFSEILFADEGTFGWALDTGPGDIQTIFETNDAGLTWRPLPKRRGFRANKLLTAGGNLWVVGNMGTILKLRYDGSAPEVKASSIAPNIVDISVDRQSEKAWFVSNLGMWRSTDAGDSWEQVFEMKEQEESNRQFRSFVSFDMTGQIGIVLGNWRNYSSRLISTRDGGKTWRELLLNPSNENSLLSDDEKNIPDGFILSRNGKEVLVYTHNAVYSSFDSGLTWSSIDNEILNNVNRRKLAGGGFCELPYTQGSVGDVQIWKEQVEFLSSPFCTLVKKANADKQSQSFETRGGARSEGLVEAVTNNPLFRNTEVLNESGHGWVQYKSKSSYEVSWLSLTKDGKHGIAVSRRFGYLIASDDSGQHWREHKVNSDAILNIVRYSNDEKEAWLVGENGMIFVSDDHGKTWMAKTKYHRLPPPFFYAICVIVALIFLINIGVIPFFGKNRQVN